MSISAMPTMKEVEDEKYKKLLKEIDAMEKFPPANIIICGIAGVGKSTLLNAVFGENLAVTGIGRPQTKQAQSYQSDNVPIRIWDTAGFEMSEDGKRTAETLNAIREIIASKSNSKDSFDRIHAIWYCINAGTKRLQPTESDFIAKLTKLGVPFIIVLTQCIRPKPDTEFEQKIREILSEYGVTDLTFIQVLAMKDDSLEDPITGKPIVIPPKNLDKLVDTTVNKMPDFLKRSFVAAQRVSQSEKHEAAVEEIKKHVKLAEANFWKDVPLARIWAANYHITKLLLGISTIYNATILTAENIKDICHDSTSTLIKGSLRDIWSSKDSLDIELQGILRILNIDDAGIAFNEDKHKIAMVVALDGFRFMKALEEVWNECTEQQLNNIDILVRKLKEKMASRKWRYPKSK